MATKIVRPFRPKWVRLKRYCELTGDTPSAVHQRRHKGIWPDGIFTKLGPDGKIWINIKEFEQWVESGNQEKQ